MKQTEKDIQNSIMRLLKKHGIYHWRNNTGVTKIGNRIVSFGKKGSSDIFCFRRGMFVAIEVKSATGKLTESQREFLKKVNEQEHCVGFVARSTLAIKIFLNTGLIPKI